jgi:hypothetical protein
MLRNLQVDWAWSEDSWLVCNEISEGHGPNPLFKVLGEKEKKKG